MEKAIEQTWQKIHTPLKAFVAKKVKEPADVDDIIQETFLKMRLNIDKLKDASKINSWIYQIARNNINDYYRKQSKVAETQTDDGSNPEIKERDADDVQTEQQTYSFSEYAGLMVEQLPEKYREAVYLTDIKGMSQKELAKKLNISVSGAKSRVQRGRLMVKDLVLQCCAVNADVYGNIIDYVPKKPPCDYDC